jgi:hypothetical protein
MGGRQARGRARGERSGVHLFWFQGGGSARLSSSKEGGSCPMVHDDRPGMLSLIDAVSRPVLTGPDTDRQRRHSVCMSQAHFHCRPGTMRMR